MLTYHSWVSYKDQISLKYATCWFQSGRSPEKIFMSDISIVNLVGAWWTKYWPLMQSLETQRSQVWWLLHLMLSLETCRPQMWRLLHIPLRPYIDLLWLGLYPIGLYLTDTYFGCVYCLIERASLLVLNALN